MKTWLKRAAAAVLSLSLLAAPVLAAAETAGNSTLNLSDNTVYTYSTQSVTSDSGKQTNLHENIFTYRKEAQVRPVVAFGSTLYGTSAMNKTIKTLEEQGYSMVAGINGSFFDRSTGIPYGIVITNSILRCGRLPGRRLGRHRRSGGHGHARLRRRHAAAGQLQQGHDHAERRPALLTGL